MKDIPKNIHDDIPGRTPKQAHLRDAEVVFYEGKPIGIIYDVHGQLYCWDITTKQHMADTYEATAMDFARELLADKDPREL